MTDRAELMESVLDCYPEGIALLGVDGQVVFWNRAAESMTGFAGMEVVARPIPAALEPLLLENTSGEGANLNSGSHVDRGTSVNAQHKLGYSVRVSARALLLRDDLGERIGRAILFRPSECSDALPRGEIREAPDLATAREKLEERIQVVFDEFKNKRAPLGLLWITVDQAHELRKTHGARACEAMLDRVERMLANGLRPQEELGRWGDDEFLVLSHERRPQPLAAFAQRMAGLTRTTDFRWWGDRISLTVSIGAALAEPDETLVQLLERAKAAMLSSMHAGGNHMTLAPGHFPGDRATESPTLIRRQPQPDATGNTLDQEQPSPEDSDGRQPWSPS